MQAPDGRSQMGWVPLHCEFAVHSLDRLKLAEPGALGEVAMTL